MSNKLFARLATNFDSFTLSSNTLVPLSLLEAYPYRPLKCDEFLQFQTFFESTVISYQYLIEIVKENKTLHSEIRAAANNCQSQCSHVIYHG